MPPIAPDLSPPARRRVLLKAGADAGWWEYLGENPAGYTDPAGVTYIGPTYTIRAAQAETDRIILAAEVEGYVLATADQYGPDAVDRIAYRDGLQNPG